MSHKRYSTRRLQAQELSRISGGTFGRKGSLRPLPEDLREDDHHHTVSNPQVTRLEMTPMDDLDLMIKNGWGGTKRDKLPPDWRTRRKGE